MPLLYAAASKKYSPLFETHSMQKGFLLGTDPEFDKHESWGFTQRIAETYEVPPLEKEHNHNPANDAYTIAHEFLTLIGIGEGKIKKRKTD